MVLKKYILKIITCKVENSLDIRYSVTNLKRKDIIKMKHCLMFIFLYFVNKQ